MQPTPKPMSCLPTGTMKQMGWCVGDDCDYRQQQRREGNERRAGIAPERLAPWRSYLMSEEKDGFYVVAVYDCLRQLWVERDLGPGDPVYVGYRQIARAAAEAVDERFGRGCSKQDCKRAGRALHVLASHDLIRIAEQGVPGPHSRRANGYRLLPLPEPSESALK